MVMVTFLTLKSGASFPGAGFSFASFTALSLPFDEPPAPRGPFFELKASPESFSNDSHSNVASSTTSAASWSLSITSVSPRISSAWNMCVSRWIALDASGMADRARGMNIIGCRRICLSLSWMFVYPTRQGSYLEQTQRGEYDGNVETVRCKGVCDEG